MERIVVIGGTGHIGTYLIPRLVEDGFEVVCVSRSVAKPYFKDSIWDAVQMVALDRFELEKKAQFGQAILALNPSVVIDLICFDVESAKQLVFALKGNVNHFLHCGSLWVHGFNEFIPTVETQPRKPLSEYGKKKVAIESFLLDQYKENGFPCTLIHPGHIVGKGWWPVNPQGNFNPNVFKDLREGREVNMPNWGLETLHHVHADDVASAFANAIKYKGNAVGESFNIVAEQAMTFKGFATVISKHYQKEPNLRFLPWDNFKETLSKEDAEATLGHLEHSTMGSIEKAKKQIHFRPKYSSLEAILEAVEYFEEVNL